jgi:hypothetical protein
MYRDFYMNYKYLGEGRRLRRPKLMLGLMTV